LHAKLPRHRRGSVRYGWFDFRRQTNVENSCASNEAPGNLRARYRFPIYGADIHLVDGAYELFRHRYAPPSARDEHGREVAAVRGVLAPVLGMMKAGATHIAVATNHVIEFFRNDLWPAHKTGEGIEPALWAQFPLLEEVLAAAGIMVWPMVEFEADDALAAAAAAADQDARVERVIICARAVTGDSWETDKLAMSRLVARSLISAKFSYFSCRNNRTVLVILIKAAQWSSWPRAGERCVLLFGNRESSRRLGGFNRLLAGIGFEGFSQKQSE
jgi:hypothetical protein